MDGEDKNASDAAATAGKNLINQATSIMPGVTTNIGANEDLARNQAGGAFNEAFGGFQREMLTGGFDPTQLDAMRTNLAGLQSSGGYDPTQLAGLRSEFSGDYATGGFDPTQLSGVRSTLAGMQATGGMDPDQLAQVLQGYGTMADTGGYTGEDIQQLVNAATKGVTTTAGNLASAASRSAAATGGATNLSSMQRTLGEQQADASTTARLGARQAQIQNQLAGLGGLGSTEQALAAAKQGVAGARAGLEGAVASGKQGFGGLQAGLESGVSTGTRDIAGQRTSLENLLAQGVRAGTQGMQGLYDTATGQVTAEGQQFLQSLGLMFGTEAQGGQLLAEISQNPGLFQTGFNDVLNLLKLLPIASGGGAGGGGGAAV